MKRLVSLTLLCALTTLSAVAQVRYSFRHFSVNDGLSQNTVTSIIQDSEGFLWFGTWDGLNKFDGHHFTPYKAHPGDDSQIASSRVDFIYQDRKGYIWFQTYDGLFHRFDPRKEKFLSIPQDIVCKRIHSLEHQFVEAADGELWFITAYGVLHVAGSENEITTTLYIAGDKQHPLAGDKPYCIDGNAQQGVWIGTNKGIQHITNDGKMETFRPDTDDSDNDFRTLCFSNDNLWFGTSHGDLWRLHTSTMRFDNITLPTQSEITDIAVIDANSLIITTANDGFLVHTLKNNSTDHYTSANNSAIISDEFYGVTLDSHGMAWLENKQPGILRFIPKDENLKHLTLDVDNVHSYSVQRNHILYEDRNGRLWINLIGGGFCYYDRKEDTLQYFFNDPNDPKHRYTNIIHAAFSDREGNLWLSTYYKGIDLISTIETPFEHHFVSEQKTLTANEVRAAHQTNDGYLILSTKDGATRFYNSNFSFLGYLDKQGNITTSQQNAITDLIYCIYEDKNKRLWLGSKGGGVILLHPNYSSNEKPKYKLQRINKHNGLSSNDIYDITGNNNGTIYVGSYGGGLNIININNGRYDILNASKGLDNYPIALCDKVRSLLLDNDGELWIGTTNGLLQLDTNGHYYHYQRTPNDSASISNNDIHCLLQDHNGTIFIGTFGGGLCKVLRKSTAKQRALFKPYTTANGLGNDIVLAMVEDRQGNIWLSSEQSVARFDPTEEAFQNFQQQDDDNNTFSESTGIVIRMGYDADGNKEERAILFGTNNGYYIFRPNRLAKPTEVPSIVFTKLYVNNQLATPNSYETPLEQSITYTTDLHLNYHQRSITVEWVGIDYESPEGILYAYYLEGFDTHWNYTQRNFTASYTNLQPRDYVLHVKSTNNDGIWCDNEVILNIHAHPAPWATGWAYIFYIMLVIGALYLMYYIFSRFNHLRNEVEVEQKVMDIKLRFFTNISHELRTPLSLIKGPVDNILTNEKITPAVREQLEVVETNTNRMLRMINQILDFRKIQAQKMRLKVQNTNIAELVSKTIENYSKEIEERKMDFTFDDRSNGVMTWVDRDKIDIVVFNLLSNAFKFTPDGKKISVVVELKNNFIYIRVIDEGIGIKPALMDKLFERYSTAEDVSLNNARGTGIGLNLVKDIVDMHKGYVEVESKEGKGSMFSVLLRLGRDHFNRGEVDFVIDDPSAKDQDETTSNNAHHVIDIPTGKELPKMVVVEDNTDMCKFIQNSFRNQFEVFTANDGVTGEKLIREVIPDLVISDLMMPNGDGLTMLRNIKQDTDTCHIPIIVLTAKQYDENRLEALRAGADDYITKPFSPAILDARVTNIMQQRQRLQEKFRRNLLSLTPEQKNDVSPDEAFLAKLMSVMEKNMDNNELTVDELVSEMALGRTVFFNKIKSLTGLSPVEFIREIRIKRAAQLLEDGKYNITEITYMVGMNDSRYFSKCFKAVYGMTPSEYKKHQQQTK